MISSTRVTTPRIPLTCLILVILPLTASCRKEMPRTVLQARSDIAQISEAVDLFRITHGRYPSSPAEVTLATDVYRPRLTSIPNDPWGHEYILTLPGDHGTFDIMTYGADGRPGGSGEDADISYRALLSERR